MSGAYSIFDDLQGPMTDAARLAKVLNGLLCCLAAGEDVLNAKLGEVEGVNAELFTLEQLSERLVQVTEGVLSSTTMDSLKLVWP